MMRYIIDDAHGIKELMSSGDMETTLTEVATLVNGLYCALAKGNEEAAEVFKRGMMDAMMPTSPVWDKHDVDCISIVQKKDKDSHEIDEIVTALRCCADIQAKCNDCILTKRVECTYELKAAAADLIENQQREIEALRQANRKIRETHYHESAVQAMRAKREKEG